MRVTRSMRAVTSAWQGEEKQAHPNRNSAHARRSRRKMEASEYIWLKTSNFENRGSKFKSLRPSCRAFCAPAASTVFLTERHGASTIKSRREAASSARRSVIRRGVPQQGERRPSPTSPSARAATEAQSLGGGQAPPTQFRFPQILGCDGVPMFLSQTWRKKHFWSKLQLRVVEALADFLAVAVEITELCVSTFGRMRLSHARTRRRARELVGDLGVLANCFQK